MPTKLPLYESPLLGRQSEIESILSLLRQSEPAPRVVTLTGPGGVGKTRLATQAALQWQQATSHPAHFVALSTFNDPGRIPAAIALALELHDTGASPILDTLIDYLRSRQVLIVLDSFEHVKAAAATVLTLVAEAPNIRFLITSRAPLRLDDEVELAIPPLVLPDLDNLPSAYMLSNYAAVALFIQRAQLVEPGFALTQNNAAYIAEICVHLDGLPLAIELAAARIGQISPEVMRERLQSRLMLLIGDKQLPARHRSLRAAIDWSYDLLPRPQQRLFTRLAVFTGGCGEAAIQAICNDSGDLPALGSDLLALIDQSLVQRNTAGGEGHYSMLEIVREYAREQLAHHGETAILHRRHTLYYLQWAEAAEPKLRGPDQQYWLGQLELELDNLEAALSWTLDAVEPELGLRLASALRWFWFVRGHVAEGNGWLEQLLTLPVNVDLAVRGKALNTLAHLAVQIDVNAAQRYAEEALTIWQILDDPRGLADAYYGLGRTLANRGDDPAKAIANYERCLPLYLSLEYSPGVADTWFALGVVAYNQGTYEQALTYYQQSLAVRREEGDTWGIARTLTSLAFTMADKYDFEAARRYGTESLGLYEQLGDRASGAALTLNLAFIEGMQGHYAEAARLGQEALAVWLDTGRRLRMVSAYHQLATVAVAQGAYEEAQRLAQEGLVISEQTGFGRGLAWMLMARGQAAMYTARLEEAVATFEECLGLARRLGDKINIGTALMCLGQARLKRGQANLALAVAQEGLQLLQNSSEMLGQLALLETAAPALVLLDEAGRAVPIWSAATALRVQLGTPLELNRQSEYETQLAQARQTLGDGFEAAWLAGKALTLDQAVGLALKSVKSKS